MIPVFLEGLGVLGKILIDLSEFEMARDILESALPRVGYLCSDLFEVLTQGHRHLNPETFT